MSKDFISFCKLAEKNSNLTNRSILPKFPPPAQLDCPQNNRISLPLCPHRSLVPSYLPFVDAAHFLLIVAFFTMFWSRLSPRRIFIFICFVASFAAAKRLRNAPPHTFLRNRVPPPCPSHGRHRILVGCCVPRFNGGHLRPWPHLPLSLFSSI